MEKNRIRPVKAGKSMRMSYSRQKEVLQMPNLIEVQKDSYQWFLKEGLKEVLDEEYVVEVLHMGRRKIVNIQKSAVAKIRLAVKF